LTKKPVFHQQNTWQTTTLSSFIWLSIREKQQYWSMEEKSISHFSWFKDRLGCKSVVL